MVVGKAAAKCFYRFVLMSHFSNSLDVAASKFNSLAQDEFGARGGRGGHGDEGYSEGGDKEAFFDRVDTLLDGTDNEKEKALKLLEQAEEDVSTTCFLKWQE